MARGGRLSIAAAGGDAPLRSGSLQATGAAWIWTGAVKSHSWVTGSTRRGAPHRGRRPVGVLPSTSLRSSAPLPSHGAFLIGATHALSGTKGQLGYIIGMLLVCVSMCVCVGQCHPCVREPACRAWNPHLPVGTLLFTLSGFRAVFAPHVVFGGLPPPEVLTRDLCRCAPSVRHPRGRHLQPHEAGGEVWTRVGSEHHRPQGAGNGQRPQLPPQDDHAVLHQREAPFPAAPGQHRFSWLVLTAHLLASRSRLCQKHAGKKSPPSRCCRWS